VIENDVEGPLATSLAYVHHIHGGLWEKEVDVVIVDTSVVATSVAVAFARLRSFGGEETTVARSYVQSMIPGMTGCVGDMNVDYNLNRDSCLHHFAS